ncbi:MAG: AbrB/MazE/SpoVT family DNA-binding domain-containing protein [Thermoplasmataceae archaeon]
MPKKVIDVSHVTLKGNSMRVTIPKKVSKELGLSGDDIIVFYDDNGIKIKKMENELE